MIPIGHIHFGDVTEASVCYTLKYLCKPKMIGKNDKTGREPEFSLMSKGIGKSYLTQAMVEYHEADNRAFVNVGDGKIQSMPRYYSDKIFNERRKEEIKKYRSDVKSNYASKVKDVYKYEKNRHEYVKFEDRKQNTYKKFKL